MTNIKQIQGVRSGEIPRKTTPFREAIIFTVGGGSLVEYENLQRYGRTNGKHIIYGATELLNPAEFLKQAEALGK